VDGAGAAPLESVFSSAAGGRRATSPTKQVTVVMNGVTGRMGYHQHLARSILAIRQQGGVDLGGGERVQVEPVLVGRNAVRLEEIAARHGGLRFTTRLDEALEDDDAQIYFDAQVTSAREEGIRAAIAAGKHVYTEKPLASSLDGALELARAARAAGVKNGVVHDKIYLPGLLKLHRLVESGFFGRILSVRGEFGYWVFEGNWQEAQRPSWNYRVEDGGGIVLDMFCHWRYVLENLFGPVQAVTARAATHIPVRYDEQSARYDATADDAAYAIFEIDGGIVAQINSSWCVRVDRTELMELQVDGTEGSAVAGLRNCKVQHRCATPLAVWNPDLPDPVDYRAAWSPVPDNLVFDNAFKVQWEQFIRHVVADEPHPHDFLSGARGTQLAEAGKRSSAEGRRIELPELVL
jgi:predicted dehydrogenase